MTKEVSPIPTGIMTPSKSHIPRLQRSASLRVRGEKIKCQTNNPTDSPREQSKCSPSCAKPDELEIRSFGKTTSGSLHVTTPADADFDDSASVRSGGSCASFMSCDINAFHSHDPTSSAVSVHSCQGPSKKYVLHCQRQIVPTEGRYLTPTQRKDRHIRQLKAALVRATRGWEEKEVEIQRLKSEVDRLRFSYSQSATSGSQQLCESPTTILEEDADSLDEAAGVTAALKVAEGRTQHHLKESLMLSSPPQTSVRPTSLDLSGVPPLQCLEDSGILSDLQEQHFFQNALLACKEASTEPHRPSSQNLSFASILKESNLCFTSLLKEGHSISKETQTASDSDPVQRNSFLHRHAATDISHSNGVPNGSRGLWDLRGDSSFDGDSFSSKQTELDDVKRKHYLEIQEIKERHNNRVETLLHKLSELNARYFEIRSAYEKSLERIRQLDVQTLELRKEMAAQEEWHSQMYLKMYRKGQEAAKFEHADEVLEFAHKAPKRVSVPELLQQLHQTEHELEETKQAYRCEMYRHSTTGDNHQAEYTLKFLKDAVFYYLTEKDNKGHLRAIESILGFNEKERATVARSHRQRKSIV